MRHFLITIIFLAIAFTCFCQVDTTVQRKKNSDTITPTQAPPQIDTAALADSLKADSVILAKKAIDSVSHRIDTFYLKLLNNPYLQMTQPPVYLVIKERVRDDKDDMFYLFAGLLIFLAFIKLVFARYFTNILRLFFQPSFRQKQTREQLQQSNLPALLLNLFFVFSGGAYLALLVDYASFTSLSFWLLFLYSTVLLLLLYTGKYVFLTFAGWVFNVKEASETYMFVVYLINKILGVLLLPFTLMVAFSNEKVVSVSITVSLLLISLLFIYRYVVSYVPVRREVKVSPLHFLFYVFAFEITPLLLIYKSLIIYLNKSL